MATVSGNINKFTTGVLFNGEMDGLVIGGRIVDDSCWSGN